MNCRIGASAVIDGWTEVGDECEIYPFASIGQMPQDLKFRGEITRVEIGDHTVIREYVTINRGTSQSFKTTVGAHCFLMSYSHLAHDCHVGDNVIMSNATQLAGHVTIEEYVIISGVCAVHQFVKVGRHAFIGGLSRVQKDIPPFVKAVGNPIQLYGLNSVGLRRRGFSDEVIAELKKAYRLLFRSEFNVSQALEQAATELKPYDEVKALIEFVEASSRGVTV